MSATNLALPIEFDPECLPIEKLPGLLLDTTMNRIQLEAEILADESLRQALREHDLLVVEGFAVPFELHLGDSYVTGIIDDMTTIRGRYRSAPAEPFVMPRIIGVLYDPDDDTAWYQSSPQEFLPSHPGIRTSNVGGWPSFDLSRNNIGRSFAPDLTLRDLERRR
ncbi:hypothetical protein [Candidatus Laterigemmans baculatus]|uniref:hypothetical protein n=1 Tax=Candidatus Laterigemmans baculatus TaxID=2770505 RepID=UPI0013DA5E3A|nr:hypothetical protein [Candidatus Laterigemmans baculatus]